MLRFRGGRAFGRARFFVYIAPCEMIVKAISRHQAKVRPKRFGLNNPFKHIALSGLGQKARTFEKNYKNFFYFLRAQFFYKSLRKAVFFGLSALNRYK